ncbi:MAG TPA: hypothetical protein VMF50_11670 [Candidatus Binataceae bacterium]|nr:hypothetical protein [Candidatus Binataceae bacterium]
MKPPFWEVTISRRAIAGEASTIESVHCFGDRDEAEEYKLKALSTDATLLIVMRRVEVAPAITEPWSDPEKETAARKINLRVLQFGWSN